MKISFLRVVGLVVLLPVLSQAQQPLSKMQIAVLLDGGTNSHRIEQLVARSGIDFQPADDFLDALHAIGASERLLNALRKVRPVNDARDSDAQNAALRHVLKGAIVAQKGSFSEAEQEYRAALQTDPANVRFILGAHFKALQRNDEASEELKEVIRLKPDFADAHNYLGIVEKQKGNFAAAEREYRLALSLDPADGDAQTNLAGLAYQKGDYKQAVIEGRKAVAIDPQNATAHNNLGAFLAAFGDAGTIAELQEAARLEPESPYRHVQLAKALDDTGKPDLAIAEFLEAVRLQPENPKWHLALGAAYARQSKQDAAVAEFREAVRLRPNDPEAHFQMGLALQMKHDLDGAISEWREVVRLAPNDSLGYLSIAAASFQKGDQEEAIRECRMALNLKSINEKGKDFCLSLEKSAKALKRK